jgi:hypothetical protein
VPIDNEIMVPSTINPPIKEASSPVHQDKWKPIPCKKSIAHYWPISKNKAVFVSVDIETGGSYCGQYGAAFVENIRDSLRQTLPKG